jgi:sigma-B regulation protein RsbU (phosphoserine phosphatase)
MGRPRPGRIRVRSRVARVASRPTALLREILDSIADGVVVADARGRLALFNPAAERMLGVGQMDVPQQEWTTVYGCFRPDRTTPYPAAELPLARALRGETVSDVEVFVRNAGTSGRSLSLNAAPLRDGRGLVRGGVVVFRDVTQRAQELRRIELLSNVVEQTADGVLVTDAEGNIEYANPAFDSITGYSREELLGRTPALLGSGEHEPAFYAELWRALMAGEVFRGAISDRRKSGEVFLAEQTITPMRGPGGETEHIVSIVKDVTELRRAQQRENALQVARRVQQRLYPQTPPRLPGLDICGKAFVADATGGDYFDFVPLAGDRLALVIGDVSGHGLDSALVMAELRAILRSTARTLADPGELLSAVNRALVEDTEESRFATALVVALHVPTLALRYASAGHTPAYLLDAGGRERAVLPALGPPLGLFADAQYPSRDGITLAPGDDLVLYTDGATDSESPLGSPFGTERLLDVVRSQHGAGASRIVEAIREALCAFTAAAPQQDDVTVVVCSVLP